MKPYQALIYIVLVSTATAPPLIGAEDETEAAKLEFFERHIRPVLVEQCYSCHSSTSDNVEGELLLDSRAALLAGGASGRTLIPGQPNNSLLIQALKHQGLEMPPERRLSDEIIQNFEKWIEAGAIDPRQGEAPPPARASSIDWETALQFWSFQPPRTHELPAVNDTAWPQMRTDWFILSAMESQKLAPSQQADRRTLARRASLDLTDLPPTFAQVDAFAADTRTDAWPRYIDHLLSSAAFGERYARLWLDIARYAEDQAHIVGDDRSLCYPNAYHYRDWVIEAFNNDLPYDQFVRKQLAVDLEPSDCDESPDLRPLGFLGLGPKYYNRGSPEVMADEWEDRVDVVTRGLLGLTVACARCHDHKYDPVPTEDYYAIAGIFASTAMFNRPIKDEAEKKESGDAKKPEEALHIVRDGTPTDLQVMIRGDAKRKGPLAARGFLQALNGGRTTAWQTASSSGRRELADAIATSQNPLVARVIVNRVWASLIGRPLVHTPSNFGRLGSLPTHPELLDDLSVRFIQSDWSIKWLVREILLSSSYQQSSATTPHSQQSDPDNVWLSHMHRKRLSIEAWRDSILQIAGRLEHTIGGPSINPQDPKVSRRTLYSEVSRLEVNKMLSLFDFPDPNAHAERRAQTTTALQKLFVLNSPFMLEQSRALALHSGVYQGSAPVDQVSAAEIEHRLAQLVTQVTGRPPVTGEVEALRNYLVARIGMTGKAPASQAPASHAPASQSETTENASAEPLTEGTSEQVSALNSAAACSVVPAQVEAAWVEVAHVLLASNELLFVD